MYVPDYITPGSTSRPGLVAIIASPYEWPSYGYIIPSGSNTGVMVRPTYSYATDNVAALDVMERQCLFDDERTVPGFVVMQLPINSKKYVTSMCFVECRQRHMIKFCGCTMPFFYPTGNYRVCNITGIKCLNLLDRKYIDDLRDGCRMGYELCVVYIN